MVEKKARISLELLPFPCNSWSDLSGDIMKPYIALLSTILVSTQIAHADNLTVQGLLDNVCVFGRLDEKRLQPDVQSVAKAMGMRVKAIPADQLPTINPDATSAWGMGKGDQAFIFAFARKQIDGKNSNSCSVSSPVSDEQVKAVKAFIETKYNVVKIADQEQGGATITAYRAELIGFPGARYFSVQHVHPGEGLQGMAMVSFFESP